MFQGAITHPDTALLKPWTLCSEGKVKFSSRKLQLRRLYEAGSGAEGTFLR